MKKITLDLTGCKYVRQIHRIIKETFGFPKFYGANYSALWDCMRDYCDDMTVETKGLSTLPPDFVDFKETMLKIFERTARENNFRYTIIS